MVARIFHPQASARLCLEKDLREVYEAHCRTFLDDALASTSRTVEATRHLFLAWGERHGRAS